MAISVSIAYSNWKREAVTRSWHVPAVDPAGEGEKAGWVRYWAQMNDYERQITAGATDPGRPVVPHRSGGGELVR